MPRERLGVEGVQKQKVGQAYGLDHVGERRSGPGGERSLQRVIPDERGAGPQPFDDGPQATALIRDPGAEEARGQ